MTLRSDAKSEKKTDSWFQNDIRTGFYYYVTYEFQSKFTLYNFSECHESLWSKQALYLKFK